ncbi:hypothetical protein BDF14DRAFT_1863896 [Spinellus fusiger]|nr:hypothetical protein BDF14DRAFT_1863896 [Spinellus fusiger]
MYKQTLSEKEKEISEQQQIITTLRQTLEERNQEFAVIKASHQLEEENSNKRERENEQKPQSISIGTNTTPVSIETHTPQKKYNDASTQTIRKRTPTQLQTAPNMDEAIERLLNEIEQAEHTHRPEISTQVSLPPSPPPHHHSKPFLSKRPLSNQWDQRFLPTEAVSWPTPQSLSVLRKTSTQETPNRYSSAISTTISTNYTQEDEALFREIEQEINSGKMLDLCLEDF